MIESSRSNTSLKKKNMFKIVVKQNSPTFGSQIQGKWEFKTLHLFFFRETEDWFYNKQNIEVSNWTRFCKKTSQICSKYELL